MSAFAISGSGAAVVFRGVVRPQTFGPQLRLTSEISTQIGKPEVVFDDEITNLSDVPQEMQLLYHTNFGTPLLGAGAQFVAPVKQVAPMNKVSAAGDLAGWNRYSGPHAPPYSAQVFNMQLHGDARGMTKAMLKSPDGNNGVLMTFDTKGLPYMSLWKNEFTAKAGYVTALSGHRFPNPPLSSAPRVAFLFERRRAYRVHLAIAALTNRSEVRARQRTPALAYLRLCFNHSTGP